MDTYDSPLGGVLSLGLIVNDTLMYLKAIGLWLGEVSSGHYVLGCRGNSY